MSRRSQLSDEVITALIKKVKSRGCIWNAEDENYNDRFQCMTAWREIAKSLNLADDLLKAKWKNLRDLFKREVKRCKTVNADDYYGKWRHFQAMWFIHRPGDTVTTDIANEANDTNEASDVNQFDDDEEEVEVFDVPVRDFVKFEPQDVDCEPEFFDDPIDIPTKKRRYNDDDFDLMFLKSLAPYFRELDPLRKLVLRSKMQDMLMNEIAAQTSANKLNKFKKKSD